MVKSTSVSRFHLIAVLSLLLLPGLTACPANNSSTSATPSATEVADSGEQVEFEGQTYYESRIRAAVACYQNSGVAGAADTGNALAKQLDSSSGSDQLKASLTGALQAIVRSQDNYKLKCL